MDALMKIQMQQIMKRDENPFSSSSSSSMNHEKDNKDKNRDKIITSSSSLSPCDSLSSSLSDDEPVPLSKEKSKKESEQSKRRFHLNKPLEDQTKDSWIEMTPYNDAQWLASMWPCQRPSPSTTTTTTTLSDDEIQDDEEKEKEEKEKEEDDGILASSKYHQCTFTCNRGLLHDGQDWYAWNDRERRWLVANTMMHRLVAESCPQPYQRLRSIYDDQILRYSLNTTTPNQSQKVIYKENVEKLREIKKHLECLHTLAYQTKVLTIAAKLFFGLPTMNGPHPHWGPCLDLLPLSEGEVLTMIEDEEGTRVEQRKAEPKDRLHLHIPTLPVVKQPLPTQWMQVFKNSDIEILRQTLSRALLRPSSILSSSSSSSSSSSLAPFASTLVFWGIDPSMANDFITFMKLTLGESYCCFSPCSPTSYTSVTIDILNPRSEQQMFSPTFKQTLLNSISSSSSSSSSSVLKIIVIKSINHRICRIPSELDPLLAHHHLHFLMMVGTRVLDPKTRFWGSSPASPTIVEQEEEPQEEEEFTFLESFEPSSTLKKHQNKIIQWLFN